MLTAFIGTVVGDLIADAQTVSFLTYLLRGYANEIRPHETSIAVSIVNLLVSCPDVISIRKVPALPPVSIDHVWRA